MQNMSGKLCLKLQANTMRPWLWTLWREVLQWHLVLVSITWLLWSIPCRTLQDKVLGLCWRQPDEDGGHTTNSIPHSFKPSLRKLAVIFRPRIFSKGEMVVRPRSCQGGVLASGAEPRQAAQVGRRTGGILNHEIYLACWRLNCDFKVWCMLSIRYSRSVHLSPAFTNIARIANAVQCHN